MKAPRRHWLGCVTIGAVGWVFATALYAGTDVQVNSDPPDTVQNEVSLTLNPGFAGPGVNVVIAHNDRPGAGTGLGVSASTDSGATWTHTHVATPAPVDPFSGSVSLSDVFDPISGADTLGNVFVGYIATTTNRFDPSGVYVERSTDGGTTWSGPLAVHNNAQRLFPGDPTYRFNDKPHLTVDRVAGSPRKDHVYVAWIQDDGQTAPSNIVFSASANSGATWFPSPVVINDNLGGPNTDMANGPNATVAPNGDVYVAWLDVDVTNLNPGPKPGILYLDRSADGGMTWGPDRLVRSVSTLPDHLSTAAGAGTQDDVRARGYPVIATDPNDATGQTVYLVYAEDPDGTIAGDEADVYFLKSTDGGLTWTSPLRVNDDTTTTDQFVPWMAVKPGGTIDVVWYDKRNGANDDTWDVYMAVSTDGGNTFSPNLRVTDQSFAASTDALGAEPWLGEYLGLAVDAGFAYLGFTSTASGDGKGDIFFDRLANPAIAAAVPVDVKPGSCPNPVNVAGQGVLPVAILGAPGFDVTTVDPASVRLVGVAPLRHALEDVGTPFVPLTGKTGALDCLGAGPDGVLDLGLKFDGGQVVQAVEASLGRAVADGEVLVLSLTGSQIGGTPIQGEDVVVVLKK